MTGGGGGYNGSRLVYGRMKNKMSKTKRMISIILAVIVLVGVGFGAYFAFFSHKNLNQKRAIKLVGEADNKVVSALDTIGGAYNNSSSSSLSVKASNALLESDEGDEDEGGSEVAALSDYIDQITILHQMLSFADASFDMTGDNQIQFGKTYRFMTGDIDNSTIYDMVMYLSGNNYVLEMNIEGDSFGDEGTHRYIVVSYDKSKDNVEGASFINYDIVEGELSIYFLNLDFSHNTFSEYIVDYMTEDTTAINECLTKTLNGTLTKQDYESFGTNCDVYTIVGNISSSINNIKFTTTAYDFTPFANYASNVFGFEVLKEKSKIDSKNSKNITTLANLYEYAELEAYKILTYVDDASNTLKYYRIGDSKEYDLNTINAFIAAFRDKASVEEVTSNNSAIEINGTISDIAKVKTVLASIKNEINNDDAAFYISKLLFSENTLLNDGCEYIGDIDLTASSLVITLEVVDSVNSDNYTIVYTKNI